MAFDAKDVLGRAVTVLQDSGGTRWPLVELLDWLNLGVREIVRLKPNATAATVELQLSEGTYQEVATNHHSLIRVIRNLTSAVDADPRVGGRAIRPVDRGLLDVTIPSWQDPNTLPYAKTVQHVLFDQADPRSFYVVPGNDANGLIEAIVSVIPDKIDAPASPTALANYDGLTVELPDEYEAPLTDYVLHGAFSKDSNVPGSGARAAGHYQKFAQALGTTAAVESIANVNTTDR